MAGVTFRKVDYWARTGVLPDRANGSGSRRRFSYDEVVLMAVVNEAQSATEGASRFLDSFRNNQERMLELLAGGVEFLALADGRIIDVGDTSDLMARVEARRASAVSLSLQVDAS